MILLCLAGDLLHQVFSGETCVSGNLVVGDHTQDDTVIAGDENRRLFAVDVYELLGVGFVKRHLLFEGRFLSQRTGRTKLYAQTAVVAVGLIQREAERDGDVCREASAVQRDRGEVHDLFTGTYAQTAEDTLRGIPLDESVLIAGVLLRHYAFEAFGMDIITLCDIQQFTFIILTTAALETAGGFRLRFFFGKA